MNQVWNDVERQFIRDNAGRITDEEGARLLSDVAGRAITIHSWRKQRQKLGLKKSPGRGVCKLEKENKHADTGTTGTGQDGRDKGEQQKETPPVPF